MISSFLYTELYSSSLYAWLALIIWLRLSRECLVDAWQHTSSQIIWFWAMSYVLENFTITNAIINSSATLNTLNSKTPTCSDINCWFVSWLKDVVVTLKMVS
jgi:hypothetical protein